MKRIFTHNWQIKLVAFVLAFAVWYLIKKNIPDTSFQLAPPRALARP